MNDTDRVCSGEGVGQDGAEPRDVLRCEAQASLALALEGGTDDELLDLV